MGIVLQMARTKQMAKRGRRGGKPATFPQGGRLAPGPAPARPVPGPASVSGGKAPQGRAPTR